MDETLEARFAEIDEAIAETNARLVTIARQNAAMSEMVEVLGSYVQTALDALQQHVADPQAHNGTGDGR